MDKLSVINEIISELRELPGINGVAIVRRDGLLLGGKIPEDIDMRRVGAMAAAVVGTAEKTSHEIEHGIFKRCVIEGLKGKIISFGAGKKALLVLLTAIDINLGAILIHAEKASEKIQKVTF